MQFLMLGNLTREPVKRRSWHYHNHLISGLRSWSVWNTAALRVQIEKLPSYKIPWNSERNKKRIHAADIEKVGEPKYREVGRFLVSLGYNFTRKSHDESMYSPWNLPWNRKNTPLNMKIIFQTSFFGFHVNFPGCITYIYLPIYH